VSGVSVQVSAQPPVKKTAGQIEKETKVIKIPTLKHHLILKLGQINSKLQYPNLKEDQRPIVCNFEFRPL
jgi:hypothetical protein